MKGENNMDKDLKGMAGTFRTITTRVSGEFHAQIRAHVESQDITLQDWMIQAMIEKMNREEGGE